MFSTLVIPDTPHYRQFCEFPTPEHKTQDYKETLIPHRIVQLSDAFIELKQLADSISRKYSPTAKNETINSQKFEFRLNHALSQVKFDFEKNYKGLETLRAHKRILQRLLSHKDVTLKSGKTLDDVVSPIYRKMLDSKNQLLESQDVAAHVILDKWRAKKEGKKVLNHTITTSQMHSLLHASLLGIDVRDLWLISRALCQEINNIMKSPEMYRGKNLQMIATDKSYYFHDHENQVTEEYFLDFRFWLEVSEDGKSVDLLIDPPNQNELAHGSYKSVRRAQRYTFEFIAKKDKSTNTYQRKVTYTPLVLHEGTHEYSGPLMKKAILFQRQLQLLEPLAKFPKPVKEPFPLVNGTFSFSKRPMTYQDYYNGNLQHANEKKTIPLDFSPNPKSIPLIFKDILNIISDVGETLTYFHKNDKVHCDVKPANILLEVNEDRIQGYVADYDLCKLAGPSDIPNTFVTYWDRLANLGFTTPFTDVFGLALSLYESLGEKPYESQDDKPSKPNPYDLLKEKGFETIFANLIRELIEKTAPENLEKEKKYSSRELEEKLDHLIKASHQSDKFIFFNIKTKIQAIKDILTLVRDVMKANEYLKCYSIKRAMFAFVKKNKVSLIQPLTDIREIKRQEKIELSVINYLEKITSDDEFNYQMRPLYIALTNPLEMSSSEIIETVINQEIDELLVSQELQALIAPSKLLENYPDKKERREALKKALESLIICKNNRIQHECEQYLSDISLIEETMQFIIKIRDEYKEFIKQMMEDSMTMATFVERLKAIRQKFLLSTGSEEKT